MPEHRGHRLGTLLKCATLEIAQHAHPERVAIHTDTAIDNHAMQATNRDFGYVPVERLHEMQRREGQAAGPDSGRGLRDPRSPPWG